MRNFLFLLIPLLLLLSALSGTDAGPTSETFVEFSELEEPTASLEEAIFPTLIPFVGDFEVDRKEPFTGKPELKAERPSDTYKGYRKDRRRLYKSWKDRTVRERLYGKRRS